MKRVTEYISKSPEDTLEIGNTFAETLTKGSVVCFTGELGAGKTTLIKGICTGLDVSQTVTSPTFTLINEYSGRLPVYHFDFYRIHSDLELLDLGLEEYFYGDGICLIEWPKIAHEALPPNRWEIFLSMELSLLETARKIEVYKT